MVASSEISINRILPRRGGGAYSRLTLLPPQNSQLLVERDLFSLNDLMGRLGDPKTVGYYFLLGPPTGGKTSLLEELAREFSRYNPNDHIVRLPLEELYWTSEGDWKTKERRWPDPLPDLKDRLLKNIQQQLIAQGVISTEAELLTGLKSIKGRVVILLDNYEWVEFEDPSSREAIENTLNQLLETRHILLIGVGRQLPNLHLPPMLRIGRSDEGDYLGSFSPVELNRFLAKLLDDLSPKRREEIARIIYEKYGGNPYFATLASPHIRDGARNKLKDAVDTVYFYMARYLALRYPKDSKAALNFLELASFLVFFTIRDIKNLSAMANVPENMVNDFCQFLNKAGFFYLRPNKVGYVVPSIISSIVMSYRKIHGENQLEGEWHQEAANYYRETLQKPDKLLTPSLNFLLWLTHQGTQLREKNPDNWQEVLFSEAKELWDSIIKTEGLCRETLANRMRGLIKDFGYYTGTNRGPTREMIEPWQPFMIPQIKDLIESSLIEI